MSEPVDPQANPEGAPTGAEAPAPAPQAAPAAETAGSSGAAASSGGGSWTPVMIAFAAIALGHLFLLWKYFGDLWARSHYQFFPMAMLGAAWMMRERARNLGPMQPGNGWLVTGLLMGEAVVLGAAILLGSSWMAMFGLMFLLPVAFYSIGGRRLLMRWLPIWGVLWITVRPPMSLDLKLVTQLQFLTSRWGSMVLDAFGVIHRTAGNILLMPKGEFLVEEACSGINSLLTVLTATLFYVVWRRWGYIRSFLLIAGAVVWVLVANLARVVGVAIFAGLYEIPIDKGIAHEIYGMFLFCGTLGLLWSTDSFYAAILPESLLEERAPLEDHGPTDWSTGAGLNMAQAGALASVFLLLFAAQALIVVRGPDLGDSDFPAMAKEDFPKALGLWRQTNFETPERDMRSNYGKHSRTWTYQFRDLTMKVSFDYPFAGWHDLTICYKGEGWVVTRNSTEPFDPKNPLSGSVCELGLQKHGRHAAVFFICADNTPKPLERPESEIGRAAHWGKLKLRAEALKRALTGQQNDEPLVDSRRTFQVQVMLHSFKPISEKERQFAGQLVRQAFAKVKAKWNKTKK